MRLLRAPASSGAAARAACVPLRRPKKHITRYRWYEPDQLAEERAFRHAADAEVLHLLTPLPFDLTTAEDLSALYTNRFKRGDGAEAIRSELEKLAGDECPFCMISVPTTFEHMFPKSTYPWLAVDPLNLASACKDCNLDRRTGNGRTSLNVYLDSWAFETPWLRADLQDASMPAVLTFSVDGDADLPDHRRLLLQSHLEERKLTRRFRAESARAFGDLIVSLEVRRELNGDGGMSLEMQACNELRINVNMLSQRYGPNFWETAANETWLAQAGDIDWVSLLVR